MLSKLQSKHKENFNHKPFVDHYIQSRLKKTALYKNNKDFRKWIDGTAFSYFTIRQEGLCFSTDFNAIYGQQRILISFEALAPYMRKKENPIAHLYQQTEG